MELQKPLPKMQMGPRTLQLRKDSVGLRKQSTLDPARTYLNSGNGSQRTTNMRKKELPSAYPELSPYLDYQPMKKLTFYNERSRREYIIKQGKTINFRELSEETRSKSSGRAQSLARRAEKEKERQISFLAYGEPGTAKHQLAENKNSNKSQDSNPRSTKRNFKRKCFVQDKEGRGLKLSAQEDSDEVRLDGQLSTTRPSLYEDTNELNTRFKYLSHEVDKSLQASLTSYFTGARQKAKMFSYPVRGVKKQPSGQRRDQLYKLEPKKVMEFVFQEEVRRPRKREEEANPIQQPYSDEDD